MVTASVCLRPIFFYEFKILDSNLVKSTVCVEYASQRQHPNDTEKVRDIGGLNTVINNL